MKHKASKSSPRKAKTRTMPRHGGMPTDWGSKPANTSRPMMGKRAATSDQGDMHTLGRLSAFSGKNEH